MVLRDLFGLEEPSSTPMKPFYVQNGKFRFSRDLLGSQAALKSLSPPWSKSWIFHCINHQRSSVLEPSISGNDTNRPLRISLKSCVLPNHIDINVIHSPQTNINVNNFFLGKTSNFATNYGSRLSARQSITQSVVFLPLCVKF